MSWTDRQRKRRSHRGRWVLGVLIVIVALVIGAVIFTQQHKAPSPPSAIPSPTSPPAKAQPASCPDVQVVAVPGTWESSPNEDPQNPTDFPAALLLNVTKPLQQDFPDSRADVVTIPYIAQFAHPGAPPQATYDASRAQGTQVTEQTLTDTANKCPLTKFVLMGFSQGAVIAGDVAAKIGAGNGPVPADSVLGLGLIADGRRQEANAATNLGVQTGVGAEVVLGGLHNVPGFAGTTMTGARPGGFGALKDRTVDVCAPGDFICSSPVDLLTGGNLFGAIGQLGTALSSPVHSKYNSFVVQPDGTTATQYLTTWASGLIEKAPKPAHN